MLCLNLVEGGLSMAGGTVYSSRFCYRRSGVVSDQTLRVGVVSRLGQEGLSTAVYDCHIRSGGTIYGRNFGHTRSGGTVPAGDQI